MLQSQQKLIAQDKLKISHPNDKYEREADRVADAVMRMPDSQHYLVLVEMIDESETSGLVLPPNVIKICRDGSGIGPSSRCDF